MKRDTIETQAEIACRTLLNIINQLLSAALTHVERERLVEQAQRILASLPLDTETYGRAACRLQNAARYLRCEEPGAARFELKLLLAAVA